MSEVKEGDTFSNGKKSVIVLKSSGLLKGDPPNGELYCYSLFGYKNGGLPVFPVQYLLNPAKHFHKIESTPKEHL